jgi:mannosyltransferase OCH1-like enzyme
MCHKTLEHIKKYSRNWKKLNPDYEIKLYDDQMCKDFLLKEYSQLHLDIFNFLKDGPIKSDFWRVCVIYKYGGLYVDADIQPLVALDKYIEYDDEFVTCISMNFKKNKLQFQLNPHFLMCKKNDLILKKCIDQYLQQYKNKLPYHYWEWSVCKLLIVEGITRKQSHIAYIHGKKYKFLNEINKNNCEYNGKVVLKNRYSFYKNHKFTRKKSKKIS